MVTSPIHPQAAVSPAAPDKLAYWLIAGLIISTTFLQKFALPLGSTQIFLGLPLMLGLIGLGLLTGRLLVHPLQALLMLAFVGILLLTQLVVGGGSSFASLALLLVVHLAYIFRLRPGLMEAHTALQLFQTIMLIMAIFGIIQFPLQFVAGANVAFLLDTVFPKNIIMQGFNGTNAFEYGGTVYKSNGFFLLEPAFQCQFLAIAVVVELAVFRKLWRLAVYLLGIALTFSGTGLLILLVLGPVYLFVQRQYLLLLVVICAVLTAGLWMPMVGLGATYDRVYEFTLPYSSGFARFLGIFHVIRDNMMGSVADFVFGMGAGSVSAVSAYTGFDYTSHNPTWGKMMYEYGLLGLLCYMIFMGAAMLRARVSGYIKAGLILQLAFLGEYLLPPTVHAVILALLVWPSEPQSESREMSV